MTLSPIGREARSTKEEQSIQPREKSPLRWTLRRSEESCLAARYGGSCTLFPSVSLPHATKTTSEIWHNQQTTQEKDEWGTEY